MPTLQQKRLLLNAGAAVFNYLLLDRFTTAAAAPLTTPRTAEPGPGTLTITDTGSRLSISGGKIVCVSGAAAASIVSPSSFTRQAGRAMLMSVDIGAAGGNAIFFGWSGGGRIFINNSHQIELYESGNQQIVLASSTNPSNLRYAIIMRPSGYWYAVKGSASGLSFPNWRLCYVTAVDAGNRQLQWSPNSNTSAMTGDDFAVVDLPAPWTATDGPATTHITNTSAGQTATATSGEDSVEHTIVAQAGVTQELMVRRTDDNNCIIIRMDQAAGTIAVVEKNAGVETVKNSTAQTWVASTTYRIFVMMIGSTIRTSVGATNATRNNATSTFSQTATGVKVSHAGTDLYVWPADVSAYIPTTL